MQPFFGSAPKPRKTEMPPGLDLKQLSFAIVPAESRPDLAENWRILEEKAQSSFFTSWHWIGCWLAGLATPPLVFQATHEGQILALGLLSRGGRRRGIRLNQSGVPDEDSVYTEFNGLLCDAALPGLEAACWRWLLHHDQPRSLFGHPGFRLERLSEASFGEVCTASDKVGKPHIDQAPFADLKKIRNDEGSFVESLSRNSRHQVRRAMKLYETTGGPLTICRPSDVAEARVFLDRLAELHQQSWQARGKAGAFAPTFFRDFHHRLIEGAYDKGHIDLMEIRCGDQPLGYLYNFLYRGDALSYQSGFRFEEDNRLKPGLICHALAAEDYLAKGASRYCFLAGDSRYKRSLANDAEQLFTIRIRRDSRLSRLLRKR